MSTEVFPTEFGCEFHHVQMYVDNLQSLETYKDLEDLLNKLAAKGSYDPFSGGMRYLDPVNVLPSRLLGGKKEFDQLVENSEHFEIIEENDFSPVGQDVVEQLIVGLGWRVTASYTGAGTQSVLITSQDSRGVKIVVTSKLQTQEFRNQTECYDHFDVKHYDRFLKAHNGYQGISVLAFELPDEEALKVVYENYRILHPKLLLGEIKEYIDKRMINCEREIVLGSMSILEAFAYYKGSKDTDRDKGTVLRFVCRSGSFSSKPGFGNPQGVLPGLEDVAAEFNGTSIPAYSDHWVSNVIDRHSFLQTLQDVLGFTPKVDFNAGVVAAGRAKIESTVTGNNTPKLTNSCDSREVLRDQSQVYLPINNALTEVGHVYGFLKQLGQGVQHLASRVEDLVRFIERVNNYRKITGRGFTFLNIPQSYYGRLDEERDLAFIEDEKLRRAVISALQKEGLCSVTGIVPLEITDIQIDSALDFLKENIALLERVRKTVKAARYSNMYSLLRDHFSEETYLQIVQNKILVDIQAGDVLFQIFTCSILQRELGDEAPFLEFIQRVCSEKKLPDGSCAPIKPGCGGFGIRNFLTLFLSIEVSKAMKDVETAVAAQDKEKEENARAKVELFTRQLDESNPILTCISDAMTVEGEALEELQHLKKEESKNKERIAVLEELAKQHCAIKLEGNQKLQQLSEHYSNLMSKFQ